MSTARKLSVYSDATDRWRIIEGDALALLAKLPENSVDAICTDPPYGLSFNNEPWDGADIFGAASRDGEHLGTGEAFERWTRAWAHEAKRVLKPGAFMVAFGAPRTAHRLACGIEDAGLEIRDTLMWLYGTGVPKSRRIPGGQGTCFKPGFEPAIVSRKPLQGATLRNLEEWGTGTLNIDAARVNGYWPANLALSHAPDCTESRCTSDCPAGLLDDARPDLLPSRLLFCSKASRRERDDGCEQLPPTQNQIFSGGHGSARLRRNIHPTVKPIALMRWLVKLVTPPGGIVLDPFTGSGSTGVAAVLEGRRFLGIEREPEYVDIACARLTHHSHQAKESS
jgi:DNA modification methylase